MLSGFSNPSSSAPWMRPGGRSSPLPSCRPRARRRPVAARLRVRIVAAWLRSQARVGAHERTHGESRHPVSRLQLVRGLPERSNEGGVRFPEFLPGSLPCRTIARRRRLLGFVRLGGGSAAGSPRSISANSTSWAVRCPR